MSSPFEAEPIWSIILDQYVLVLLVALAIALFVAARTLRRNRDVYVTPEIDNSAILSDKGNKSFNQDSVLLVKVFSKNYLRQDTRFVVAIADGVSGTRNGEEASKLCTDTVARIVTRKLVEDADPPPKLLGDGFREANRLLNVADEEMGRSTLTGCVYDGHDLSIAHVGDSRAYIIRGGQAFLLTSDHTLPSQRNVLTRWIGQDDFQPDESSWEVESDDIIVLCSDGLTKFIQPQEIPQTLTKSDLRNGCQKLVTLARARGSVDDVSIAAIVVD